MQSQQRRNHSNTGDESENDSETESVNSIHPPCRRVVLDSTLTTHDNPHPTNPLILRARQENTLLTTSFLPEYRFAHSSLHQRDPRSDLFKGYSGSSAAERRSANASPARYGGGGGYGYGGGYGGGGSYNGSSSTLGVERGGFRPATPNSRGQYSDAVLNELESQNDEQVEGIMGKVKILKDVRFCSLFLLSSFSPTSFSRKPPIH